MRPGFLILLNSGVTADRKYRGCPQRRWRTLRSDEPSCHPADLRNLLATRYHHRPHAWGNVQQPCRQVPAPRCPTTAPAPIPYALSGFRRDFCVWHYLGLFPDGGGSEFMLLVSCFIHGCIIIDSSIKKDTRAKTAQEGKILRIGIRNPDRCPIVCPAVVCYSVPAIVDYLRLRSFLRFCRL